MSESAKRGVKERFPAGGAGVGVGVKAKPTPPPPKEEKPPITPAMERAGEEISEAWETRPEPTPPPPPTKPTPTAPPEKPTPTPTPVQLAGGPIPPTPPPELKKYPTRFPGETETAAMTPARFAGGPIPPTPPQKPISVVQLAGGPIPPTPPPKLELKRYPTRFPGAYEQEELVVAAPLKEPEYPTRFPGAYKQQVFPETVVMEPHPEVVKAYETYQETKAKGFLEGVRHPGAFMEEFQREKPGGGLVELSKHPAFYAGSLAAEVGIAVGLYGVIKVAPKIPPAVQRLSAELPPRVRATIARVKPTAPPSPMKPLYVSEADWYRKLAVETGPARAPRLTVTRTRVTPTYIQQVTRQIEQARAEAELKLEMQKPIEQLTAKQLDKYFTRLDTITKRTERVKIEQTGKTTFVEPEVPKGYQLVKGRAGQVTLQKLETVQKVKVQEPVKLKPPVVAVVPVVAKQEQVVVQKQKVAVVPKLVAPQVVKPVQIQVVREKPVVVQAAPPKQVQKQIQIQRQRVAAPPMQVQPLPPRQVQRPRVAPLQVTAPRLRQPTVQRLRYYTPLTQRQIVYPMQRQVVSPMQIPRQLGVQPSQVQLIPQLQIQRMGLRMPTPTRQILGPYIPKRKRVIRRDKSYDRWLYSIWRNIPRAPKRSPAPRRRRR